ncbi:hypothetical protein Tco_0358848 [Tanacetum coccineum]
MLGLGNKSKRVFFVELKWVPLHLPILDGKSQEELEIVIYTERSDNDDSWGWKNLLTIRDQVKENVIYKVGNGRKTSLWFDNWSSIGPLFQSLTHRDLYDERLNESLTVSDLVVNGKWKWPEDWFEKFPLITSLKDPSIEEDREDQIVWKTKQGNEARFSMRQVNIDLTPQHPKVPYALLLKRAIGVSSRVRKGKGAIAFWAGLNLFVWAHYAFWAKGHVATIVIQKNILIFGASVYSFWAERNRRIFQDKKLNDDDVFKRIVDVVKGRILGLTVKDSNAIKKMEEKWKISCRRLPMKPPFYLIMLQSHYFLVWPWEEMGSSVWLCRRSNSVEVRKVLSEGGCFLPSDALVSLLFGLSNEGVNGCYAFLDDATFSSSKCIWKGRGWKCSQEGMVFWCLKNFGSPVEEVGYMQCPEVALGSATHLAALMVSLQLTLQL